MNAEGAQSPALPGLRPDYGALVVLLATVAAFALAAFAPQLFNDGDTYFHIRAGEWMLDHRAVLYTDPFSYTRAGAPWETQEWLAQIFMALAFRWAGWSGLAVLFAAAFGATAFLLARKLSAWLDPLTLFVTLVLVLGCAGGSMLARPHLLALPLLVLWTAELIDAREESRAPRWMFLGLMALWANLHGSFFFGLVLIVPFALEALAEAKKAWRNAVLSWGGFAAGAVVAALATPHGFNGLVFPLKLMAMRELPFVREWQSSNFAVLSPFELGLLTALYVFLSRGVRVSFYRLLTLLVMLHMALQHERQQTILALCGPLILAKPMGEALNPARRRLYARNPRTIAVLLAVCVSLAAVRLALPVRRGNDSMSPLAALAHVPPDVLRKPVFNDYTFGAYLIFAGIRPFIDSRADLYGDRFLLAYREMAVPDRDLLDRAERRYGFAWAILRPENGARNYFDGSADWRRVYADPTAIVYLRRSVSSGGGATTDATEARHPLQPERAGFPRRNR